MKKKNSATAYNKIFAGYLPCFEIPMHELNGTV